MKRFLPFAGRRREIDLLEELLEGVLEYSGSTVFLRGGIGVGKTRLLDHFSHSVRDRGFHLLRGRSVEEPARSYSSFSTMVEDFLCQGRELPQWMSRHVTPETAVHFMSLMPSLSQLYPVEVRKSVHSDTASIVLAFMEFFRRLSRSRPLLLVLDDIQWMSDDELDLLGRLADRILDMPVLMLAGIRSGIGNSTLERITEELAARRLAKIMQLQNLSAGEVAEIVEGKLNNTHCPQFKEWLARITGGNPLFIEEILKTLIRQNVIRHEEEGNRWTVEDDYMDFNLTETVESVVKYRLSRLGPEQRRALECAAVIGDRFEAATLLELLDRNLSSDGMQPVNILVSQGMLVPEGDDLSFSHPLLREVLYRHMDTGSRRGLHRRLASILEGKQGRGSETFLHLTRDLQPEEETAGMVQRLLSIATEIRESTIDYRMAHDCLKEALRIAGIAGLGEEGLLVLKAELNWLSWIQGRETLDLTSTRELLGELIEHDLREEALSTYHILFHSALGNRDLEYAEECLRRGTELASERNGAYWNFRAELPLLLRRKGHLDESLEASLALIEEIPVHLAPEALYRVQTNMGLVSFLTGEQKTAVIHLGRARDTVRDYGLLHRSADSRLNLGLSLMTTGDLDGAMTEFREAVKEAGLMNREPLVAIGHVYMANCLFSRGDTSGAVRAMEEASRIASETGNPRLRLDCMLLSIKIALRKGDAAAAAIAAEMIESTDYAGYTGGNFLIVKARVALARNRLDEAEEVIEEAISSTRDAGLGTRHGIAMGVRALVRLREGREEEALGDLDISRSLLLDKGEVAVMSEILVQFGLEMGGGRGEGILTEGVELLKRMRAFPALEALHGEISNRRGEFGSVLRETEVSEGEGSERQIQITTFGGLSIGHPDEPVKDSAGEPVSSKSRELLALLVTGGSEGLTREAIISRLWPETPERKALASLRVALTGLRKAVGSDALVQDGPYLKLDRELVRTDMWEFDSLAEQWKACLRSGTGHAAEDRARRALELYRGDFLPEFYATVLEDQQFRLMNAARELMLWMAERNLERVEHADAVRWGRRLLAMDPCSEKACRIIMKGLAAMGDRAAAIRQYQRLKNSLASEFRTVPDGETTELYERILSS